MKNSTKSLVFYIAVFIAMFALTASIYPLSDDWYYSTAPNVAFTWDQLLPQASFWRPLDVLFGALMGLCPALFPALNRAAVILAHILSAVLLGKTAKIIGFDRFARRFAVGFFLFSSAVPAVIASPDALNQAYCLLFGMLGLYVHLKRGGWLYLLFSMIAILWKEAGISWFFVIPLVEVMLRAKTFRGLFRDGAALRRFVLRVIVSLAAIAAYFALRFLLYGQIALGDSASKYSISIFSMTTVWNVVLLLGSAAAGIDTIALCWLQDNLLWLGVSLVMSLAFLLLMLICICRMIRRREGLLNLLGWIGCVLVLIFPHAVIQQAGEMHAYPVLLGMALLYGHALNTARPPRRAALAGILCIFVAFAVSGAHKFIALYDYSDRTRTLTENIHALYDDPDDASLFVSVESWRGYSVFSRPAIHGADYGSSLKQYYGWRDLNNLYYKTWSREDAEAYIETYGEPFDAIFLVTETQVERVK